MTNKNTNQQGFSIGAFGVIFDKKKKALLVKRRDYPLWNLPGGRVESGENPSGALEREIEEEIGAKVASKELFGIYFKKGKDEIVFCYSVVARPFTFRPTDEAVEIKYFSPHHLPENLPQSHRERIEDVLSFKGQVIQKIQVAGSSKKFIAQNTRVSNPQSLVFRGKF